MSSYHFYIKVKASTDVLKDMLLFYRQCSIYQETFHFGMIQDATDDFNAGFVALIDNFLPTCHLVYDLLSPYSPYNLYIKVNGVERLYDFEQKSDFVKFMYDAYENKIDYVYESLGVILLNFKKYDKIRNKLYNKYYQKIQIHNKFY